MRMRKENANDYILRCIGENKISVDCENGEIFSNFTNRNFKQLKNNAGHHFLDFKFFNERKGFFVHRIIYLAKYGEIPDGCVIDHIDGDPSNNKISNLRAVSQKENLKNRRMSNGSSGAKTETGKA